MNQKTTANVTFLLPFSFDADLLLEDLEKCEGYEFHRHYVPSNYNKDKYILPLRSIGGDMNHVFAAPEVTAQYQDTAALKACPYFQKVIDTFECPKESIRIMRMSPGGEMKIHTDLNCGYEDGVFRTHIPIKTNDQVRFMVDGSPVKMSPGETWYINANLPHGVTNGGETDRVHLVLDCLRNEWSDEVFKSMGYDFEEEVRQKQPLYSQDTIRKMIEGLSEQDNEASAQLIADLKKQLEP